MGSFKQKSVFIALCFTSCMLFGTDASRVTFHAYPNVLKANLTDAVSMRCALSDTEIRRGASVTNTTEDIAHVTSILITSHDGQVDVAHGSTFDAPTALSDLGNLAVKGDVTGTTSEGYLELTWAIPSLMTLGEYACEITTIDVHHRVTVFRSTLQVSMETPSINDIVVKIEELTKKDEQNAIKISALTTEVTHLKQQILNNQSTEILNLKTEVTHLKQNDAIKTQMLNNQSTEILNLKTCTADHAAFMAVMSGNLVVRGYNEAVIYDTVVTNTDGGYNSTSGTFKCKSPGVYVFTVNSVMTVPSTACYHLKLNSNVITSVLAPKGTYEPASTSAVVHLNKDDIVQVTTAGGCDTDAEFIKVGSGWYGNVFAGHLQHSDAC